MPESESPLVEPGQSVEAASQQVTVPEEHNSIVVRQRGQSWTSVCAGDLELIREESPDPIVSFIVKPGTYTVRSDGAIDRVDTESVPQLPSLEGLGGEAPALLRLSSDAPDQHVLDGIGEIPADGQSQCTITVEKTAVDGTPLTREEDRDEVFMRTTGGVILHPVRDERIRSLQLQSGKASFRLRSEDTPKLVTVFVLGHPPQLAQATIQLEFI